MTSLTHEVSRNGYADAMELDVYSIAAAGEFGCWIDVSLTRVIQTGIEHLLLPSASEDALISQLFFLNHNMMHHR